MDTIKLSPTAQKLLDKLITDFKSKLKLEERTFEIKDGASLIYNLFNGKYEFSFKTYKELFNYLNSSEK